MDERSSSEAPYLESFLTGVPGSAWLGTVSQFFDSSGNISNPSGEFGGSWHDNDHPIPRNPSDAQVQAEALVAKSHFGNDPTGVYFIATPQGNWSPGFAYGSTGGFCAYHGATGSVTYVNFPYQVDSQSCTGPAQQHPGSIGNLDVVSVVGGHELAEVLTDPYLNAWYDSSSPQGQEIGDKCAWANLRNIKLPTGTFTVQPLFDNSINDCAQPDVGSLESLGNPSVMLAGAPALGRNPDGRLESIAADANGQLWHIWQNTAGGTWSNWSSLGGYGATAPCEGSYADGRLDAATVNTDGTMTQYWQTSLNGTWTSSNIGGPSGGLQSGCAMANNQDGRLEVVATGRDGNLYHAWQYVPNGSWTGWVSLGNPGTTLLAAPAIARNASGPLEVVAAGSNSQLYHVWQNTAGGSWGAFASLGVVPSGVAGQPSLAVNTDGRLEAFIGSVINGPYHVWQTTPSGNWTGPVQVAPPPSALRNVVGVALNAPGEMEVFATTTSGAIWTSWQINSGGSWTSWESLGADQTTLRSRQSARIPTGA